MKYTSIMVRFGELNTKGKNKKNFIHALAKNIKCFLKKYEKLTYDVLYDHIYINLNGENYEKIIDILKNISGIHSLSLVIKINSDIEEIKKQTLSLIKQILKEDENNETFKIICKRSNKNFYITSKDIIFFVAANILKNTKLKVDVHQPKIKLNIEVRNEGTYIFYKTILANGGYPNGVAGKVLMMLSGGIDSPVATYLIMKRGITVECIHFASPPYTSEMVIDKLKDILKKLSKVQYSIKLHIVNFTNIQTEIYDKVDTSYAITIMRRMMYRIAEKLAVKLNCLALANGESIGQVSSQTLYSIQTIEEVIKKLPVFRPLSVFDKLDIIKIANDIDTYSISIRPFEDCCTIFPVKHSKTKPHLDKILLYEEKINFEDLINKAVNDEKTIIINNFD